VLFWSRIPYLSPFRDFRRFISITDRNYKERKFLDFSLPVPGNENSTGAKVLSVDFAAGSEVQENEQSRYHFDDMAK